MISILLLTLLIFSGYDDQGEREITSLQYYHGELKLEPDYRVFRKGEDFRIVYRNNAFHDVFVVGQRLERLDQGEWKTVRTTPHVGRHPIQPGPRKSPRRLRVIMSRETFEYNFPHERLAYIGNLKAGRYRFVLSLTSNPDRPDYARLCHEFEIR